jgi:pSer/pThr/pTyr-binding forkhead associated (FHA) protein
MIACPVCKKELMEGTVFCTECGASLVGEDGGPPAEQPTTPSRREYLTPVPEAGGRTTAQISPTELRLLVLNSGRTIPCPMQEVILVGRSDFSSGTLAEVDLTHDNGYMAGVSRRHARIIRRGDEFYLEDLDSMNGTFLNGSRLPKHTPVLFQNGDEIRLGNLVLRVILEGGNL